MQLFKPLNVSVSEQRSATSKTSLHSEREVVYNTIAPITEKDMILICSDGVHGAFEGIQIQQLFNTSDTLDEAIGRIEKQLKNEAKDDFSLLH